MTLWQRGAPLPLPLPQLTQGKQLPTGLRHFLYGLKSQLIRWAIFGKSCAVNQLHRLAGSFTAQVIGIRGFSHCYRSWILLVCVGFGRTAQSIRNLAPLRFRRRIGSERAAQWNPSMMIDMSSSSDTTGPTPIGRTARSAPLRPAQLMRKPGASSVNFTTHRGLASSATSVRPEAVTERLS
jgi:hypothetical protein